MAGTTYTDPQWDRSALVVVDVQNDFVDADGAMPVSGTVEALPRMASVVDAFRAAGRPVVHIVRLYVPGDSDVDLPRRALIESGAMIGAPGTAGSQIPPTLLPHPVELDVDRLLGGEPQQVTAREVIFFKPRWSAFHRTGLHDWLQAQGVSTVVVLGCNLPNCPRATLFDGSNHDYRTVLVTDATSQTTPDRLADLELIGVNLLSTADVVGSVSNESD